MGPYGVLLEFHNVMFLTNLSHFAPTVTEYVIIVQRLPELGLETGYFLVMAVVLAVVSRHNDDARPKSSIHEACHPKGHSGHGFLLKARYGNLLAACILHQAARLSTLSP